MYIFIFTIARLINSGTESGIKELFRLCQDYFVFLWIISYVLGSKKNKTLVFYSILLAFLVSIIYGLMQTFHLDIFHRQSDIHRLSGFHKNAYTYGGQLIVFFFFLLYYLKKKKNIFAFLGLFFCFFCILNTSERAVILGIFAGLVVYILFGRFQKSDLFLTSVTLFIPFILTSFINQKVLTRIKNIVLVPKIRKKNVRFKLWQIAIGIFKKNYLFGIGKFPVVYHDTQSGFNFDVLTHAHNVYLQILVTHGIFGFIAFINLIFSFLRSLFVNLKTNEYALCLISVIFAYLVEGFFEYFWGDTEVRYLFLFFSGFVFSFMKQDH